MKEKRNVQMLRSGSKEYLEIRKKQYEEGIKDLPIEKRKKIQKNKLRELLKK